MSEQARQQTRPECCGRNFSRRPVRPAHLLAKYPASSERILKADGCAAA
jgi:hypothetical protein